MNENPLAHIVATECNPDVEERFNKWYDEVHVPMLFRYPGMKKVTRLKRIGDNGEPVKYLAVYEFASQEDFAAFGPSRERQEAMAEMKESWPEGGFEIKWTSPYEAVRTWQR